jgi:type I restriction enzyme S subunit
MSSNEWQTYRLDEVLEVKYGKDHKSLSSGHIPVYGSGGIMRYANKSICNETSILIPRKGTLNNIFYLDKPFWTVDTMFWTILNTSLIDPKFLFYKLTTFNYSEMNVGTAVPSMTVQVLNELLVTIPEKTTQVKISFILSTIDSKIENNLKTNQTLEEIARTIFKQWFVNYNYPNTDTRKKQSEFGEIPADWQVLGIGEVCYVQNGYAFKSNDFKSEGEVKIIKIKNINGNVVDIEKTDFVDANVVERLDKKFKIESGSLLIAMTGAEVGKIGLVPLTKKNLWLNQRVGMFKEKIAFGNLFMYLLLSSDTYQTNIQNSALGSAQPNISASAIESIRAIIPPAELIEAFGKIVNPMFNKILDNLAENETLKTTRDSLLPKLMSGEIDVNISKE